MSLTNTGENNMLTRFKEAGDWYLALYTTTPSDTSAGTEVSGNGYARQKITFGSPSGGSMSNSAAISFPTASGSWGTVNGFGIISAVTGGTLEWWGAIDSPKEIVSGDIYRIDVGGLTLSMD